MSTRFNLTNSYHLLNKSKLLTINSSTNNIHLLPSKYKKEEILFSNKSNKEILLSLIKTAQTKLLSKIKNSTKDKIFIFKNILKELKEDLSFILDKKYINKNYLEINLNNSKIVIQNKKKNKDNNSIRRSNKEVIIDNLETEVKEINYDGNELSKLKLQIFKIENEILKTDFLIFNRNELINSLKETNIFPENDREFFLYNEERSQKEIDNIFISRFQEQNELLKKYINLQNQQKYYIEQYNIEIEKKKKNIKSKNFMDLKDIIFEKTLENEDSSELNSSSNSNNIKNNCKDSIKESKGVEKNVNISSKDDIYNIIKNNKNSREIVNLNMNINFNINIGKI
jgi:hypothetical protein